jgi:hypothetical protein
MFKKRATAHFNKEGKEQKADMLKKAFGKNAKI